MLITFYHSYNQCYIWLARKWRCLYCFHGQEGRIDAWKYGRGPSWQARLIDPIENRNVVVHVYKHGFIWFVVHMYEKEPNVIAQELEVPWSFLTRLFNSIQQSPGPFFNINVHSPFHFWHKMILYVSLFIFGTS